MAISRASQLEDQIARCATELQKHIPEGSSCELRQLQDELREAHSLLLTEVNSAQQLQLARAERDALLYEEIKSLRARLNAQESVGRRASSDREMEQLRVDLWRAKEQLAKRTEEAAGAKLLAHVLEANAQTRLNSVTESLRIEANAR